MKSKMEQLDHQSYKNMTDQSDTKCKTHKCGCGAPAITIASAAAKWPKRVRKVDAVESTGIGIQHGYENGYGIDHLDNDPDRNPDRDKYKDNKRHRVTQTDSNRERSRDQFRDEDHDRDVLNTMIMGAFATVGYGDDNDEEETKVQQEEYYHDGAKPELLVEATSGVRITPMHDLFNLFDRFDFSSHHRRRRGRRKFPMEFHTLRHHQAQPQPQPEQLSFPSWISLDWNLETNLSSEDDHKQMASARFAPFARFLSCCATTASVPIFAKRPNDTHSSASNSSSKNISNSHKSNNHRSNKQLELENIVNAARSDMPSPPFSPQRQHSRLQNRANRAGEENQSTVPENLIKCELKRRRRAHQQYEQQQQQQQRYQHTQQQEREQNDFYARDKMQVASALAVSVRSAVLALGENAENVERMCAHKEAKGERVESVRNARASPKPSSTPALPTTTPTPPPPPPLVTKQTNNSTATPLQRTLNKTAPETAQTTTTTTNTGTFSTHCALPSRRFCLPFRLLLLLIMLLLLLLTVPWVAGNQQQLPVSLTAPAIAQATATTLSSSPTPSLMPARVRTMLDTLAAVSAAASAVSVPTQSSIIFNTSNIPLVTQHTMPSSLIALSSHNRHRSRSRNSISSPTTIASPSTATTTAGTTFSPSSSLVKISALKSSSRSHLPTSLSSKSTIQLLSPSPSPSLTGRPTSFPTWMGTIKDFHYSENEANSKNLLIVRHIDNVIDSKADGERRGNRGGARESWRHHKNKKAKNKNYIIKYGKFNKNPMIHKIELKQQQRQQQQQYTLELNKERHRNRSSPIRMPKTLDSAAGNDEADRKSVSSASFSPASVASFIESDTASAGVAPIATLPPLPHLPLPPSDRNNIDDPTLPPLLPPIQPQSSSHDYDNAKNTIWSANAIIDENENDDVASASATATATATSTATVVVQPALSLETPSKHSDDLTGGTHAADDDDRDNPDDMNVGMGMGMGRGMGIGMGMDTDNMESDAANDMDDMDMDVDMDDMQPNRFIDSDDNQKLMRLVMSGLGLDKLPDMDKVNISQREYVSKYREYLRRVHERKRRELAELMHPNSDILGQHDDDDDDDDDDDGNDNEHQTSATSSPLPSLSSSSSSSSARSDPLHEWEAPLHIVSIVTNVTENQRRQKRDINYEDDDNDEDDDDHRDNDVNALRGNLSTPVKRSRDMQTTRRGSTEKTRIHLHFPLADQAGQLRAENVEEANIRLMLIQSAALAMKSPTAGGNSRVNSVNSGGSRHSGSARNCGSARERKMPPKSTKQRHVLQLKIYQLLETGKRQWVDGRKIELEVDKTRLDETHSQWLEFDVTRAVEMWLSEPHTNLGLEVQCDNCQRIGARILSDLSEHGHEYQQQQHSIDDDDFHLMPVLNIIGRIGNIVGNHKIHSQHMQQHSNGGNGGGGESGGVGRIGGGIAHHRNGSASARGHHHQRGHRTNCYKSNQRCCRHSMEVIFKEIKGFEFIIQPKVFDAGYCHGRCPPRYNPAHHHAMLQSLIWKQNRQRAPRPCCAPSKLVELEVLHVDEKNSDKLKISTWTDMRVVKCACS